MNGGQGWRVVGCGGGGQDKTIINKIMLRFRPIAPKPVSRDPSFGAWNPEGNNGLLAKGRTKRKYVRVKKNNEMYRRRERKLPPVVLSSDQEAGVRRNRQDLTLQLLPEGTGQDPVQVSATTAGSGSNKTTVEDPGFLENNNNSSTNNNNNNNNKQVQPLLLFKKLLVPCDGFGSDRVPVVAQRRVVETWVTVESVADPCMVGGGLACSTDMERMKNLEEDTCPGFISDGSNTVRWVNGAYKRMVMVREANDDDDDDDEHGSRKEYSPVEIKVRLVIKEKLLPLLHNYYHCCSGFTCWVRLLQKEKCSKILVPCDVCRMDYFGLGGFAWRMDVKAALGLSRLSP